MKLELYAPLWPLKGVNYFFNDPKYKGHNGLDFFATHGTPIYATHEGLAQYQVDTGGGHGVVIISNNQYDMKEGKAYIKTIYWHMVDPLKEPKYASPLVGKTGLTPVKRGELIGYADSTGNSTGSHLHFGMKRLKKGSKEGVWITLNNNNGYNGAIDPIPYLVEKFDHPPMVNEYKDIISRLQRFLVKEGFLLMPPNAEFGYFGELTKDATTRYQKTH